MICLLQLKLSGWIAHTSLFTLLLVKGMSKLSYLVYPPNICLLFFFFLMSLDNSCSLAFFSGKPGWMVRNLLQKESTDGRQALGRRFPLLISSSNANSLPREPLLLNAETLLLPWIQEVKGAYASFGFDEHLSSCLRGYLTWILWW